MTNLILHLFQVALLTSPNNASGTSRAPGTPLPGRGAGVESREPGRGRGLRGRGGGAGGVRGAEAATGAARQRRGRDTAGRARRG